MGFLKFFGGGGGSKIQKLTGKVTEPYMQTAERQRCMQLLADEGSEDALFGLMQRFTFRTEASIVDHDEKQMAYELLVSKGTAAIPAIERFVTVNDAVYWPLKALKDIGGLEAAVALLMRALDAASKKDTRVNEHKVQLVSNLRDFPHPQVQAKLAELVTDPNEDVRIMAIDGLATYGPEVALEPMAQRILDPDESPRVKTILYEQLIDFGWSLEPWRPAIEETGALPEHYRIGAGGKLERA